MPGLDYITPGNQIPRSADTYNALVDAARAHKQPDQTNAPALFPSTFPNNQTTIATCRNDSMFHFDQFAVVGIDEPVTVLLPDRDDRTEIFKTDPILSIRPPEACRHRGRWGVLLDPLPPGHIGRIAIAGVAPAYVGRIGAKIWPSRDPVNVDIEHGATGDEYHLTTYGNRRRDGVWYDPNGSGQIVWAGKDSTYFEPPRTVSATAAAACDSFGTGWFYTRDGSWVSPPTSRSAVE